MVTLNPHIWSALAVFAILAPSPAPAQVVADVSPITTITVARSLVEWSARRRRHRGRFRDVGLSHRSERAGKRRRLCWCDRSGSRRRRRPRRLDEQGRTHSLCVAPADTTLADLTGPWKRSARRACFGPLLTAATSTRRATGSKIRGDRSAQFGVLIPTADLTPRRNEAEADDATYQGQCIRDMSGLALKECDGRTDDEQHGGTNNGVPYGLDQSAMTALLPPHLEDRTQGK